MPGTSEDIAHYNRLDEDAGGDRSYKFLYSSVQRCIRRDRQQKVRSQLTQSLGGAQPSVPAKGQGKGTENERGRSAETGKKTRKTKSNSPRTRSPVNTKEIPCIFFAKGECRKGASCIYDHSGTARAKSPGRKGSCHLFAQGECHYGDNCKYSHEDVPAAPAPRRKKKTAQAKAKSAAPAVLMASMLLNAVARGSAGITTDTTLQHASPITIVGGTRKESPFAIVGGTRGSTEMSPASPACKVSFSEVAESDDGFSSFVCFNDNGQKDTRSKVKRRKKKDRVAAGCKLKVKSEK